MRKILIAVMVMVGFMFAHAPKDEVTKDRPLFHQGTVKIQLKDAVMASKAFQVKEYGKTYSVTGITSIDNIGEKIKASSPRVTHIEAKNKDLAKELGLDRWITVTIPEDQDVMAAVQLYKADPNVSFAQPEYANYLMATPNDTYFTNCWGHNNTVQLPAYSSSTGTHSGALVGTAGFDANTKSGWDGTQAYGSSSIIIAIMDTGIDYDHPDIAAHYVGGYDFAMSDTNPDDNEGVANVSGHGTSCAGVAAGVINNGIGVSGVAGNCSVMALKILNSSGSLVGMANAAIWGADNGADIISMSFGGDYQYGTDATADAAYTYAYSAGVTLLAATGNDETLPRISYPANHPDIIGVGAAAPDNGRKTTTSIDGETWWASQYCTVAKDDRAAVDIIAPTILPATDIVGTGGFDAGDYGLYFNGTSCATPYAAGFAGLIKSKYPSYTPTQVRSLMTASAQDIDDEESVAGWDGYSGYGLINIAVLYYSVDSPASFTATSYSTSQINLSWAKNASSNDVMILYSTTGTFGDPVNGTTYTVGQTISGGGTVAYTGPNTSYNHTGLPENTMYYYRAYSYNTSKDYSFYLASNAPTLMNPLSPSAASLGFENGGSIPSGWSQEGNWTFVTTATRPTAPSEGSYFAFINTASSTKKLVTPRFDLTTHTGVTINFDYLVSSRKVGPTTWYDKLKVYYKTSATGSWVLLSPEYSGSYTAWQTATLNISDAVRTNDFYFAFEGILGTTVAYGVSVDDIVINGTSGSAPPTVPTLASPTNGSSTSDLTPTFDWNDVATATSYTIQIDDVATFASPNYTNSPTTSTYTPAANLATGTWYWRVLATNTYGSSAYTSGWSVILGNAPAVPTLALPTNGSSTSDLTPTFDWNDVSGATSYTIQIDNDVAFGSVDYTNSPTTSTYTPAANLAVGTWYWRVLATNAFGSSTYTSGWSVILGSAPAAPTLATPTDASTLYILKPSFDWNDVSGATSYTLLVDNNSDFSSPEISQSPTVSTYTPVADMALGTYYWKVLSTNSFGSSSYSSTWSVILAPLTAPINVITGVVSTDLTVSWDAVAGATSYDVYSATEPYGTFTFVTNVATNSYVTTTASTRLFWYIVAKN